MGGQKESTFMRMWDKENKISSLYLLCSYSPGRGHRPAQVAKVTVHDWWWGCSVAQSCLTVTTWTAARQASLSFTTSRSFLRLMSHESVYTYEGEFSPVFIFSKKFKKCLLLKTSEITPAC